MKTDTPSRTAQYMALFRAIESERPPSKRLFYDPYAIIFLDETLKLGVFLSGIPVLSRLILTLIQNRGLGALSSGIARTKYIDDLLKHTISKGVEQVIILGAGFDTRALRLEFLKNIPVIEIDHPDTAKVKINKLRKTMGYLPENVKYYQIDFNKTSLTDLARKEKLNLNLPTVIIWEGVTNYLNQDAIDKTFEFTEKFTENTYIIFTYINKSVLDNPQSFQGTKQLFKMQDEHEEKWTFGFKPESVPDYLNKFNLSLIEDNSAIEYRNKYIPERTEILKGYEFYRVAIAQNKGKNGK